jgi:hypothetical protein
MKANTCQLLNKNCLDGKEVYKFNPKLQYLCRGRDFVLEQKKTNKFGLEQKRFSLKKSFKLNCQILVRVVRKVAKNFIHFAFYG